MKKTSVTIMALISIIIASSLFGEDDKIKIKGDFRYRHETIDQNSEDTRNRHRIRMRLGLTAIINQDINAAIQFSSGGDDPVSNNQTLGDSFSTKDTRLDLAYVVWKPKQINGLELYGGKLKNPYLSMQKSELLWDPDLNPEGIAGKFDYNLDQFDLFINGGFFWIEERSDDDDSYLAGGQAGIQYSFPDEESYIIVGGGYYDYLNTQGFTPFYDEDGSGNSLDNDGNYREDYNELDFFAEAGTIIRTLPVAIFGDIVTNTAADEDNLGWLAGINLGKTKNPGSWKVRYQYKYQEKDAVIGIFTDSDFLGGGTNGRGHEINFDLVIMENTTFATTYFINQIDLDNETDFNRLQVDLSFKF
jgi:hypothetical protein